MRDYFKYEKKLKYLLRYFILLFISFIAVTCNTGGVIDAPPPFVELTEGPSEGEVLSNDKVIFAWRGNGSDYKFKYRMLSLDSDNFPTVYQDSTSYSNASEVTFSNLDEGNFRFELYAKSNNVEPSSPLVRDFTVDAIKGPSLMFYKTKTVIDFDSTNSVGIWMEDVNGLTGFSLVIAFDKNKVNLVGATKGAFVIQKRFEQIIVPDLNDTTLILKNINATGKIEITSAFLTGLGTLPDKSISGSGKILNLVFKGIAKGISNIDMTTIDLRDQNGVVIHSNAPKSGILEVQ
jgi:hypothetical protein